MVICGDVTGSIVGWRDVVSKLEGKGLDGVTGAVRRRGGNFGNVGVNEDPVKYNGMVVDEWDEGALIGSVCPNCQRLSRTNVAMWSSSNFTNFRCVSMRLQLSKQEPRRW